MAQFKRGIIAALFCAGMAWGTQAVAQDAFKQANAAYADGRFAQAADQYESARSEGTNHWVLHYNLGNAYFKGGQTGKAIASYLRAFRLQSNQKDVVYNLNLALTHVGDPLVPGEALAALFWRFFYLLPLNGLTIMCAVLWVAICVGAGCFFLGFWRPDVEPAVAAVLLLLLVGCWLGARIALVERLEGVVIAGTAEVRAAPNLSSPANFTIPEGRRVLILEEQEPIKGWLEIGVPKEGLKGWVPDASVEAV